MYNNNDIQDMISKIRRDSDMKKAVLDMISNERDRAAVSDVLNDGSVERFDRYDSDVCEQFIRAYEKINL